MMCTEEKLKTDTYRLTDGHKLAAHVKKKKVTERLNKQVALLLN